MPTVFQNPLEETDTKSKVAEPCVLVIFGATGDLTRRKLMPALYNLAREGQLPAQFACVAFARREKGSDDFRAKMSEGVNEFSRVKPIEDELWKQFSENLHYHQSCFDEDEGYQRLHDFLADLDTKLGTKGNRVFYLSTQPSYFPIIVEKLHKNGMIYNPRTEKEKWSRVIIEKPFGRDYDSGVELQEHVTQYLHESQIYRIDHYLGKETVQNLLTFRFANALFESLWNSNYIDHIQITVGEEIGIGTRGHFFEEAGMMRDIVQNHMMQLLSLVAMEPPVNLNGDSIRDEKVKVLESIRPINMSEFSKHVVRGQYDRGYIDGDTVCCYREEENVHAESAIETFVALQLFVDNWRWAGVPFYMRAGKRLPKRATEIAIQFKPVPSLLFGTENGHGDPNVLVIRIQPNEGINLKMNCKIPGLATLIQPVKMDFRYGQYFGATPPEAYERLICDCMLGDSTLFARGDEVLASWRLLTPILERWQETQPSDFPNYRSGTWGPEEADEMLARNGHKWRIV